MLVCIFFTKYAIAQSVSYSTHYDNTNFTKTIDLTKAVGVVNGQHAVSGTGGAMYTIPIAIPVGTGNLVPNIALVYNSQGGNGGAGYGWNLSGLSAINRVPKNWYNDGEVKATSNTPADDYAIDGNRLILQSGTNGTIGAVYATENETYSTAEITNGTVNGPWVWKVTAKDGTIYMYGNEDITTGASVNNSGNWVYWRLYKIIDKNGNYVQFKYDNTDNDSRIKEINYTGNQVTGLVPYNKMLFEYKTRFDPNTIYDNGLAYNSKYLLDKIVITGEGGQAFKTYQLNYSKDDMYSYLKEIIEEGTDGTQLNSTIFKYGEKPTDIVETSQSFLAGITCDRLSGDFDGDGYTDLLTTSTDASTGIKFITDFRVWKRTASSSSFVQSTPTYGLSGKFELKESPFNLYHTIPSDFDGDGRDDILFTKTEISSSGGRNIEKFIIYHPNLGATNFTPNDYYPPNITVGSSTQLFNKILNSDYLCIGDFDGDGKSDYITFLSNGFNYKIFFSSPTVSNNNIVTDPDDLLPNDNISDFTEADANYTVDFNGDGKSDIMNIRDGNCKIYELITSSGPNPYELHLLYSSSYPTKWHNIYFGDFNGDRKTDLLTISNTGQKEIAYSTGTSYSVSPFTFVNPLTMSFPPNYSDNKLLIADYNGDGLSDIAHCYGVVTGVSCNSSKINIYYSTGSQFYYQQYTHNTCFGLGQPLAVDFNGDGRAEIINYGIYTNPFHVLEIKPYGTERLLNKKTNGFNATTVFEYDRLTNNPFYMRDAYSAYPLNTVQFPFYAVSRVIFPNGIGGTNSTTYQYEDARMHRAGRGFLGFTKVIERNFQSNIKTISENNFDLNYYIPLQKSVKTFLNSTNTPISEDENIFGIIPIAGLGKRFKLELASKTSKNLLQNIIVNAENTYDSYGNITLSTSTVNTSLEIKTIHTTYGAFGSTVPYLPTYITATNTRAGNPSVTKNTQFAYNTKGNVLSTIEFDGLPEALTTTFTYNPYGLKLKETISAAGLAPRSVEYAYDAKSRFVKLIKKNCTSCGADFSQIEKFTYEPLWGKVLTHTSTDCNVTTSTIDAFGRTKKTTLPTGAEIVQQHKWDISPTSIYYTETNADGSPDGKTWFDLLGRETKAETELLGSAKSTILTTYNNKGLLNSKTNAHIVGTEAPLTTSYTYDTYNRIAKEITPYNTFTYSYLYNTGVSILETKIIDNQGTYRIKTTDASGKVTSTQDMGGRLQFAFDSWGNVISTNQNASNVSLKEYNPYNRLLKTTEVNAGTIHYLYNAYGELISETDASSNTHTFTYDDLGRLLTRTGTEGTTSYQYYCAVGGSGDEPVGGGTAVVAESIIDIPLSTTTYCCNNNITKITGFSSGIVQDFEYDVYGRLLKKDELVDGSTYSTSYTYDTYGNVLTTTYPSGLVIEKTYDINSYLMTVKQAGATTNIWQTQEINGMGQIKKYQLGNGLQTQKTYTMGFLTDDFTPGVQHFKYAWDYDRGNLLTRGDNINGTIEAFTYDNLDRLTTAQVTGQPLQTFKYDPYPSTTGTSKGNIKINTEAGYYRYTAPQIYAQSSIANLSSTTLPPANIPADEQNITYQPFQRVKEIEENNYIQKFEYWPSYDRVKSELLQGGVLKQTRYYFGDFEKNIDELGAVTTIHYIAGGDGICAIIRMDAGSAVTTHYVYKDHLGSFTNITNDAGVLIAQQSFDAWGRKRNPTDWTYSTVPTVPQWLYRGYTGHEHMPQFGLINMNARLYDPVVGKMLSVDNYVSDPTHTQAYNRYSYANNNPLIYTDPDGNFIVGTLFTAIWDFGATIFTNGALDPWNTKQNRQQAWANYDPTMKGTKTNNSWRISKGSFKTDENRTFVGRALQLISRFSWELMQTGLGNLLSHVRNITGSVDNVDYYGGATLVNNNRNSGVAWGLTLGNYINSENVEANPRDPLFMHEYGHTLQSRLIDPFYFTRVGIPSFLGSGLEALGLHPHNDEWNEIQANRMAYRYFNKFESNSLNSTLGGTPWDDSEYPRKYVPDLYFILTAPPIPFLWWLYF